MDILKEVEQQISSIKKVDNSNYLDSIFIHIHRAEFYYKQGSTDSNYFNDVIYRSNQAYEGALKESYKVLAGKSQDEDLRKPLTTLRNILNQTIYFVKEFCSYLETTDTNGEISQLMTTNFSLTRTKLLLQ